MTDEVKSFHFIVGKADSYDIGAWCFCVECFLWNVFCLLIVPPSSKDFVAALSHFLKENLPRDWGNGIPSECTDSF